MLHSMTGFGKATGTFESKKVSIEIRSLNSKSVDLNIRSHPSFREVEPLVRKLVAEKLERGKIDVSINLDSTGEAKSSSINQELAKLYLGELKELSKLTGQTEVDYMSLLLRMPEIYNSDRTGMTEEEQKWLMALANEACQQLNEFRRQEGQALEREFTLRIEEIRTALQGIPQYEQERVDTVRERMRKALDDLEGVTIDNNRLEQEMIYYMEKLDVSEEKMRLANHLDYFLKTMKIPHAGKKLGFISQEIGREINTLGSKSNHSEMQKLVVEMKDCLEKIKEQILNTL